MEDLRFEKFVEVLYDQLFAVLPAEARRTCPALKCLSEILMDIKEANNDEIALELGMLPFADGTCPCRTVKRKQMQREDEQGRTRSHENKIMPGP